MAPSLLQGVWISCRATPCQEMGERKEEKGEVVCGGARGREAWMTQATGLCNQKGRERQRHGGRRKGKADMQATEESGNTPTFVT